MSTYIPKGSPELPQSFPESFPRASPKLPQSFARHAALDSIYSPHFDSFRSTPFTRFAWRDLRYPFYPSDQSDPSNPSNPSNPSCPSNPPNPPRSAPKTIQSSVRNITEVYINLTPKKRPAFPLFCSGVAVFFPRKTSYFGSAMQSHFRPHFVSPSWERFSAPLTYSPQRALFWSCFGRSFLVPDHRKEQFLSVMWYHFGREKRYLF